MTIETPLFSALLAHKQKKTCSLHVPGHKNGHVFFPEGEELFQSILSIDLTELRGLDDLHDAEGPIKEAQDLLASLYQSEKSFFLVNGSTVGNLAMILGVVEKGDLVLVQRNSHKSIMNGLELAGAIPILLAPEEDTELRVASGVNEENVYAAIEAYPTIRAVILTNPTYYGTSIDLRKIARFLHERNIPLLVDEAHGAHFVLGEPFPTQALSMGADVVVQSAHKTLPAMTMGSFLHIRGNLVNDEAIKRMLAILQSSSPSYPIMASLDLARAYIEKLVRSKAVGSYIKETMHIRHAFAKIDGVCLPECKLRGHAQDPLKLVVQSDGTFTGYELQQLFEEYGVYSELADPLNVLMVFPLTIKKEWARDLLRKLSEIQLPKTTRRQARVGSYSMTKAISKLAMTYEEMRSKDVLSVTLQEAVGKVCAEPIVPYPPGIPLLLKGEIIELSHIELIQQLLQTGARFQGGALLKENKLKVFSL